jgi:hypothetical protein
VPDIVQWVQRVVQRAIERHVGGTHGAALAVAHEHVRCRVRYDRHCEHAPATQELWALQYRPQRAAYSGLGTAVGVAVAATAGIGESQSVRYRVARIEYNAHHRSVAAHVRVRADLVIAAVEQASLRAHVVHD